MTSRAAEVERKVERRPVHAARPRRAGGIAAIGLVSTLVRHRSLVAALLVRTLSERYRGSSLGFFWTFVNPILLLGVYSLVFSFYLRIEVPNYTLFVFSGLLPWMWFSSSLLEGVGSVAAGSALVKQNVFPAEILPAVTVLASMTNFLLSAPMLLALSLVDGVRPDPLLLLFFPAIVAVQCVFTFGIVLALAAWNVHYRDVQHLLGNFVTLWFFLTPILYPLEQIPAAIRGLTMLNPMLHFAHFYQSLFARSDWSSVSMLPAVLLGAVGALVLGARVFDDYRDSFPELV